MAEIKLATPNQLEILRTLEIPFENMISYDDAQGLIDDAYASINSTQNYGQDLYDDGWDYDDGNRGYDF